MAISNTGLLPPYTHPSLLFMAWHCLRSCRMLGGGAVFNLENLSEFFSYNRSWSYGLLLLSKPLIAHGLVFPTNFPSLFSSLVFVVCKCVTVSYTGNLFKRTRQSVELYRIFCLLLKKLRLMQAVTDWQTKICVNCCEVSGRHRFSISNIM